MSDTDNDIVLGIEERRHFAEILRKTRRIPGITKKRIAEVLDVPSNVIERWENVSGEVILSSTHIAVLAKLRKCTDYQLLNDIRNGLPLPADIHERNNLGRIIREMRVTSSLTKDEFADQLGVKRTAVQNWENGENSPSEIRLGNIVAIAKFRGCTVDQLLKDIRAETEATLEEALGMLRYYSDEINRLSTVIAELKPQKKKAPRRKIRNIAKFRHAILSPLQEAGHDTHSLDIYLAIAEASGGTAEVEGGYRQTASSIHAILLGEKEISISDAQDLARAMTVLCGSRAQPLAPDEIWAIADENGAPNTESAESNHSR